MKKIFAIILVLPLLTGCLATSRMNIVKVHLLEDDAFLIPQGSVVNFPEDYEGYEFDHRTTKKDGTFYSEYGEEELLRATMDDEVDGE